MGGETELVMVMGLEKEEREKRRVERRRSGGTGCDREKEGGRKDDDRKVGLRRERTMAKIM